MLFAPTLFYFVGQMLDDYIWTPMIQGKSTGLDTPVILFASIAGGALFGVFGLLIAIPLAACAKILIQEIFWPRFKDWAEGRSADPLPIDEA
jgi:predicted PurR-regulated permease PerM